LIGAALTITPLVFVLWLDSLDLGGKRGILLAVVGLLAAVVASGELTGLIRAAVPSLRAAPVLLASAVALLFAAAPVAWSNYPADCPLGQWGWTAIGMVAAMGGLFLVEMLGYRQPGEAVVRLALGVFAVSYVTLPLVFLLHLRRLGSTHEGILSLVSVILVVKLADSGAYFTGRAVGRHKMAPVLSPKKTWEGAVGAFVAAWLGGALFFYGVAPLCGWEALRETSWLACSAYALPVAAAGMVGDLAESLLKRDLQVKDSAAWVPGLGGVLDVLDSLLFAAPVAYLWWVSR
jgi:phosphatidate cytidylyltransferase